MISMFDATALGRFQRRRLLPAIMLASTLGVCVGALGAKLYVEVGNQSRAAAETKRKDPFVEGALRDLKAQLTAQRAETEALTTDLRRARREKEHLTRELSRAMENLAALRSDRDDSVGASPRPSMGAARNGSDPNGASPMAPAPPTPPRAEAVAAGQSVRPPRQEAGLPVAEAVPDLPIRRIFRAKSPGIRLEDLSRHYGVSMENLRRANPDLRLEVRPAGHFLLQGTSVNIPAVEE